LPHLQKLYDKYRDQGFSMVAINVSESQAKMIPEWMKEKNFRFPVLVGATREFLSSKYDHRGSPTNLLVDSEGRVLFRHLGYGTGGEKIIEAEIRSMLGLDPSEVLESAATEKAPPDAEP